MAIIKPAFKDYEYGWYGFNCSIKAYWFNTGYVQQRKHSQGHVVGNYGETQRSIKKQIPKLKGVIFIYGNYKDSI